MRKKEKEKRRWWEKNGYSHLLHVGHTHPPWARGSGNHRLTELLFQASDVSSPPPAMYTLSHFPPEKRRFRSIALYTLIRISKWQNENVNPSLPSYKDNYFSTSPGYALSPHYSPQCPLRMKSNKRIYGLSSDDKAAPLKSTTPLASRIQCHPIW